jgi:quercetin dioxygenase-like cupin family protein
MAPIEEFPEFVRTMPEIDLPFPDVRGWLLQGQGQQVAFVEFDKDVEVPEHAHEEQWEFPVAGMVELHIMGDSREYLPGDDFYIPAGVPHSASVKAGYKAIIFFNSSERYSPKKEGESK